MFQNLFQFEYKRSNKEAVGFYIGHLIILVLLSGLLGGISAVLKLSVQPVQIGMLVASIVSVAISVLILQKKNLFNNFLYVILALGAGILGFCGGGLLGLIIPAYFSTR